MHIRENHVVSATFVHSVLNVCFMGHSVLCVTESTGNLSEIMLCMLIRTSPIQIRGRTHYTMYVCSA